MGLCFFASDLHGRLDRYEKLFLAVESDRPAAVFLGGDLLPNAYVHLAEQGDDDFLGGFLAPRLETLRDTLGAGYPRILAILGNDDMRADERVCGEIAERGLWDYIHNRRVALGKNAIYGYACVPPTPFGLKDWERYDVSRYVPHGCVSPEEGYRSVPVDSDEIKYSTIRGDLTQLAGDAGLEDAVFLFHTPPFDTALDRAALEGRNVDGVPMDLHVGSIAVRRFIEEKQPLVTLHGHIHESARLTGSWRDRIGRTHAFSAAHDGPELALVRFSLDAPGRAERLLL